MFAAVACVLYAVAAIIHATDVHRFDWISWMLLGFAALAMHLAVRLPLEIRRRS